MKPTYLILFIIVIFLSAGILFIKGDNMELTSTAFENNGMIPEQYTCDGNDISPPLNISQIPEGTKSLVLIMDDPDAVKPAGKVWDHWIVFNIPSNLNEIEEGKEPQGIQGITSFGRLGYGGPCPPDNEHSYIFKLYALDIELDLVEGASKEQILELMNGHVLEEAELIGRYSRQ